MSNLENKLEVRVDKDQLDRLVEALDLAADSTMIKGLEDDWRKLSNWLTYRRVKRWGHR